jgi:hypothetical protein
MNIDFSNQLYKDLKDYIAEVDTYGTRVRNKSLKESDKFPLITITEDDNVNELIDTRHIETTDKIYISVNIYAQDKAVGNTTVSNVNIARELAELVDRVLGKAYRMERTSCKPTPNLDDSIYRITMKYTKKIITNKNILI